MGFWRLLPAALGIGVPTMMQVGPDDAILNPCKWPRKLAPSLAENCLPGTSANDLYAIAALLVCVGIVWFAWPYRRTGTKQAKMFIGILVLCCGIGIGAFGLSIIAAGDEVTKVTDNPATSMMTFEDGSRKAREHLGKLPYFGLGEITIHGDAGKLLIYYASHLIKEGLPIYRGNGVRLDPVPSPIALREGQLFAGDVGSLYVKPEELGALIADVTDELKIPPGPQGITIQRSKRFKLKRNEAPAIGINSSEDFEVEDNIINGPKKNEIKR